MFNRAQRGELQLGGPLMKEEAVTVSHKSLKTSGLLLFEVSQRSRNLPNVSLADKNTGMVNALGKSELEDLSLQPPLQEILNLQTQDVIELHLTLIQHTDPHQTPEQGITCKNVTKREFSH